MNRRQIKNNVIQEAHQELPTFFEIFFGQTQEDEPFYGSEHWGYEDYIEYLLKTKPEPKNLSIFVAVCNRLNLK